MKSKSNVVLLIPGIFDLRWSMTRMQRALEAEGFSTHYIHLRYNSGWHGMEHLSQQLQRRVEELTETGSSCSLVGFSMGGIVARYYLQRLGGLERVHKFVAISSPHFGSYWARFLPYLGGRQLRIGSDFLADLNADLKILSLASPVSIWTRYDITILPHSSALLPIGNSYQVPALLHRMMPSDRRVISLVRDELADTLQ